MPPDDDNEFPDRILRIGEVVRLTSMSVSTIWREIDAGRFPAPLIIAPPVPWMADVRGARLAREPAHVAAAVAHQPPTTD